MFFKQITKSIFVLRRTRFCNPLINTLYNFTYENKTISSKNIKFSYLLELASLWHYSFSPMRHRGGNKWAWALQLFELFTITLQSASVELLIPAFNGPVCSIKITILPSTDPQCYFGDRTRSPFTTWYRIIWLWWCGVFLQDVTHPSTNRAQCCLTSVTG
jgi:hypothetical protein